MPLVYLLIGSERGKPHPITTMTFFTEHRTAIASYRRFSGQNTRSCMSRFIQREHLLHPTTKSRMRPASWSRTSEGIDFRTFLCHIVISLLPLFLRWEVGATSSPSCHLHPLGTLGENSLLYMICCGSIVLGMP